VTADLLAWLDAVDTRAAAAADLGTPDWGANAMAAGLAEDAQTMSAALRAIAALCEHGISRPTAGADFREFVDTVQTVLGRLTDT
jgi:hypothetical protein